MAKKGQATVLKNYFGTKDSQSLAEFLAELKTLAPAEKLWLAQEAAKDSGLSAEEVDFPLS